MACWHWFSGRYSVRDSVTLRIVQTRFTCLIFLSVLNFVLIFQP
jgi:hypothetical protein